MERLLPNNEHKGTFDWISGNIIDGINITIDGMYRKMKLIDTRENAVY